MRLILIGFGNVGRSFLAMITEEKVANKFNSELKTVAVLDRKGGAVDPNGLDVKELLSTNAREGTVAATPKVGQFGLFPLSVIKEVEADVVLELTPTNPSDGEPAVSYIETAIRNGKNVVTTNKAPPALAMKRLQDLASLNKVHFGFSGTVGGGTPILELVKQTSEVDEVLSLRAILNGTTNYILSKMYHDEISMQEALQEAQHHGYAERDPSLDINGTDSALKLAIIANYALERKISPADIEIKGITDISLDEVQKNKEKKKKVKLICSIGTEARVAPEPIKTADPICVDGPLNSVQLRTKYTGEITMMGPGAGGCQTATAILNDLLAIERSTRYLRARAITEYDQ
jgi:homoserine dehydrogenase